MPQRLRLPSRTRLPARRTAAQHSWIVPDLLSAAKTEGALTVYGSMNEQEALPLWKTFEDATGVKVSYVRSSDTQIMARVAIENRAAAAHLGCRAHHHGFAARRPTLSPSSIRRKQAA